MASRASRAGVDRGGGLYLAPVLYDVVNTPDTAPEVDALERAARRFARRSGESSVWLEPACGTGRYLRVLARRGRRVRGYDPLPAALRYARGRLDVLGADHRLVEADFTAPLPRPVGRADVAFCPVNSVRHLPDDRDVLAHFEQIASALRRGGVYLVGIDLHHAGREPDEDVWTATRGALSVQQVIQYLPPEGRARIETVIVELVITRPRGTEHAGYRYGLRTYTAGQWDALVNRSALRRVATCDRAGRPVDRTARLPYQIEVLAPR
jgi:SAM-dependent methyltransferase